MFTDAISNKSRMYVCNQTINLFITEITACNRANVCTYAVMGALELDQPGFTVEIVGKKGQKSKTIVVCSSCARAMRGRHKIQRLKISKDFVCAMGTGMSFCFCLKIIKLMLQKFKNI